VFADVPAGTVGAMILRRSLPILILVALSACSDRTAQPSFSASPSTPAETSSEPATGDTLDCTEADLEIEFTGDAEGSVTGNAIVENGRLYTEREEDAVTVEGEIDGDELTAAQFVADLDGRAALSLYTFKTVTIFDGDLDFEIDGDSVSFEGSLPTGDDTLEIDVTGTATC
jgi:hypothetical protein